MRINEAGVDAIVNEATGLAMFATTGTGAPDAAAALSGDRRALRRVVKSAIRATIATMEGSTHA